MENKNANTNSSMRNPVFDIMKGLGIILVMLGHAPASAYMSLGMRASVVHSFVEEFVSVVLMPMFFLLAGYFTKPYNDIRGGGRAL